MDRSTVKDLWGKGRSEVRKLLTGYSLQPSSLGLVVRRFQFCNLRHLQA